MRLALFKRYWIGDKHLLDERGVLWRSDMHIPLSAIGQVQVADANVQFDEEAG